MNVSYWLAFVGGLLSFFTPCILPLLPLYYGYLAGETLSNIEEKKVYRRLVGNSLAFVLGLTLINLLLGFGAKALSDVMSIYTNEIRTLGGVLLILFGAYFISGLQIGFMEKERKITYKHYAPSFIKSFILGLVFSFGWTPCNGPIIASILFMASFKSDYLQAGSLMLVYSLGFSVLFILSAIAFGFFRDKVRHLYKYFKYVKWVSGLLMIAIGLLMVFNKISLLAPTI